MPFDDWKSCRRDKRLVGSNPTLSVIYFSNNKGFRHLRRNPLFVLSGRKNGRDNNVDNIVLFSAQNCIEGNDRSTAESVVGGVAKEIVAKRWQEWF